MKFTIHKCDLDQCAPLPKSFPCFCLDGRYNLRPGKRNKTREAGERTPHHITESAAGMAMATARSGYLRLTEAPSERVEDREEELEAMEGGHTPVTPSTGLLPSSSSSSSPWCTFVQREQLAAAEGSPDPPRLRL